MFLSRLEGLFWIRSTSLLICMSAPLATAGAAPFTLQHTYLGTAPADQFGFAVQTAGDVNGDGYADFMVGANASDAGAPAAGAVSLYVGGTAYASAPWNVYAGAVEKENCGGAVGGGGDLNGDGYDDWVVGAPGLGPSGDGPGCVYVFFGGAAPALGPDRILRGTVPGGQFGAAVLAGADLDGDGYDDLVIGAPRAGDGEIHVYRGGPGFVAAGPARIVHARPADNRFGKSLAWLPDTNGDGCDDLLVGVPRSSVAATWAGAVLLYRGTAALDTVPDLVLLGQAAGDEFGSSLAAGADVDGDGAPDLVVGAPLANVNGNTDAGRAWFFRAGDALDAVADCRFDGTSAGALFGSAIAAGFDWDSDGNADLAVGAPGDDAGGLDAGRCLLFFGGGGLDAVADASIVGSGASAHLGCALSSLGRIRGDGRGALLLGAYGASENGQALLFASSDGPVDVGGGGQRQAAQFFPAFPNPSPSGLFAVLQTFTAERWNIDVFDARGRHVAHLYAGFLASGIQRLAWDGRDRNGVAVASGVYCLRATSGHTAVTTRAIVVR